MRAGSGPTAMPTATARDRMMTMTDGSTWRVVVCFTSDTCGGSSMLLLFFPSCASLLPVILVSVWVVS
eukprot:CAMPEP_0178554172 /NCGR_PEP_ID=MMETSP0697-20121206/8197_1 /TAXON_ID=265572 /ORGANISM="Extubocellulus spinifer, Strain CCMP396" /LENGTH=67 /DNA_ID=CAMNT_0020187115 /DNA_START=697 /DNA_END=896 /DNA_ORIENTATION=+